MPYFCSDKIVQKPAKLCAGMINEQPYCFTKKNYRDLEYFKIDLTLYLVMLFLLYNKC